MVIIPYFPISATQLMKQNYWDSFLKQNYILLLHYQYRLLTNKCRQDAYGIVGLSNDLDSLLQVLRNI